MEGSTLSSYRESLDFLFGLQKYGIKFGLNSTESLLAKVGDPHRKLRCIHVGGTNGKGSTAAMLSTILRRHGYRVGLYTSPHLVRFTERFRIDDAEVKPERILEVFERLRSVLDEREPPTFFEMVTAMAFLYFAEEQVDWAVIEVGMGGRLDATNVIRPQVSVITNVAMDHQEFLGNTLASIAREKAGIIKENVPVVTGVRQPVVQSIMKTVCLKQGAPLYRLGTDFRVRRNPDGSFQYQGLRRRWPSLDVNLVGPHQYSNGGLALATLEVLEKEGLLQLDPAAVADGLSHVFWPGRVEILEEKPFVVLDGAHNPQGAEALREALRQSFSYRRLHLVMGIMADKDIQGIFKRLLPMAETVIFTQPKYSRAADAENLCRLAEPYIENRYVVSDISAAIAQARLFAGPDDLICITGSLYFAGEVKELFGEPTL
ncbi:MAG: bifunctional folylpolyglutamate synthase/dihydrofolate synthase [Acidobacteriota bacterium]